MAERWQLWTDGGARGNPGPAAAGVVVARGEEVVHRAGVFLGERLTNNQAEYRALQLGLAKARELGATEVLCHVDSQLVAEQLKGRYKVKEPDLRLRWEETRQSLEAFAWWDVRHVRRGQNQEADRLVNETLDRFTV